MHATPENARRHLVLDGFRLDLQPRREFGDGQIFLIHTDIAQAQHTHKELP